jgi:Fic family protein
MHLQLLPSELLPAFLAELPPGLEEKLANLHEAEISTADFSFYISVASVYSSKIEGESMELDSYIKHKKMGVLFQPDYAKKIDDLYEAYSWAQQNTCSLDNLNRAHAILSRNLLATPFQGKYRTGLKYVTTPDGKIDYVAAAPEFVTPEMEKFGADLAMLCTANLSIEQAFFYASMLHLVLVKIHPYTDGNGRTARLLEKWFLAEKLGPNAWLLTNERSYYEHHAAYCTNLRSLGLEYETLDYSQALPFLKMVILRG